MRLSFLALVLCSGCIYLTAIVRRLTFCVALLLAFVLALSGCYHLQRPDVEKTVRAGLKAIREARAEFRRAGVSAHEAIGHADERLKAGERYCASAVKAIGPRLREDEIPPPIPAVAEQVCREIDARTQKLNDLGARVSGGLMEKVGWGSGGVGILAALVAAGAWLRQNKRKLKQVYDQGKGIARLYVADKQAALAKTEDPVEQKAMRQDWSQQQEKEGGRELVQEVLKEAKNGTT